MTNINKYKFFDPTTGKNQEKLDKLEDVDVDNRVALAERQKILAKERAEMAYMEMVSPEEAQRHALKFMYEDITRPAAKKETLTAPLPDPSVHLVGGFRHDDSAHKAFLAETRARQLQVDSVRKVKDDPMAAFGKVQSQMQRQVLMDPTFLRNLKKQTATPPTAISKLVVKPIQVVEKRVRHDSDDEKCPSPCHLPDDTRANEPALSAP